MYITFSKHRAMETQNAPWLPGIRNGEQVRPGRAQGAAQVCVSTRLGSQEPTKHILETEDSKCEQPQMRPGLEPPRHSQEPLLCGGKMWGLEATVRIWDFTLSQRKAIGRVQRRVSGMIRLRFSRSRDHQVKDRL